MYSFVGMLILDIVNNDQLCTHNVPAGNEHGGCHLYILEIYLLPLLFKSLIFSVCLENIFRLKHI